jgi:hypothetical protein
MKSSNRIRGNVAVVAFAGTLLVYQRCELIVVLWIVDGHALRPLLCHLDVI